MVLPLVGLSPTPALRVILPPPALSEVTCIRWARAGHEESAWRLPMYESIVERSMCYRGLGPCHWTLASESCRFNSGPSPWTLVLCPPGLGSGPHYWPGQALLHALWLEMTLLVFFFFFKLGAFSLWSPGGGLRESAGPLAISEVFTVTSIGLAPATPLSGTHLTSMHCITRGHAVGEGGRGTHRTGRATPGGAGGASSPLHSRGCGASREPLWCSSAEHGALGVCGLGWGLGWTLS